MKFMSAKSNLPRNQIRTSEGYKAITGIRGPVKGRVVQVYSRVGAAVKSSKIHQLNVCGGSVCNLVATEQALTKSGDSGGPWFAGTVAYGIHAGTKTINKKVRSLFTPITAVQSELGLKVLTR